MVRYSEAAWERAMKVQELILRAMAKRITWWQAAEILGISDRSMRRWKCRYEQHGYDGLFDRQRGRPSPRRVAMEEAEEVLRLYQERYGPNAEWGYSHLASPPLWVGDDCHSDLHHRAVARTMALF